MKTTDAFCFVHNLLFSSGEPDSVAIGTDAESATTGTPRITFPEDTPPAEVIRAISSDVNLALDIFADAFDGSERTFDRAMRISDRIIDEEREATEDETAAIRTLENLGSLELSDKARILLLRRIDTIRKTVNVGLTDIAVDMSERRGAQDDSIMMDRINSLMTQLRASAYAGAREATIRNAPKIITKALSRYDAETVGEAHEDEKQKKTRKPGGGRKRTFDLDRRQVRAVLSLALQFARPSARSYCEEIIRRGTDDDGRPFSEPFTDAKKLAATVAAYCEERGGDFMSDFVKKTPKKASNTLGKKYRT